MGSPADIRGPETGFQCLNNILYKYQFGFRKNHGINLALTEIIDSIYRSLDSGKMVCGVFLDLQKAFDTVQHNILLHKLFNCSVRGIVQNWFHSYLNQRCHHTVIGKVNSPMSYVIVEYHKALYLVHFCF